MPSILHTLMRENISLVNARTYSAARTDVTIQMALDSIGSLPRRLLLTDEDDGIWTLNNDITIPANVVLTVPIGVTIVGAGDLTILGGIQAWRWPVYTGTGIFTWTNSTASAVVNTMTTHALRTTALEVDTLDVNDTAVFGAPTSSPAPPDNPIPDVTDWGILAYNSADVGGQISNSGTLAARQDTRLTADTLLGSSNVGIRGSSYMNLNGYHFIGVVRAGRFVPGVFGSGGVLDSMVGLEVEAYCMESSTTTGMVGLNLLGVRASTTGVVSNYTGANITDIPAGRITSTIRGLVSEITTQGTEDRYNLYISGTARNHFAGNVGIGAGSTDPKHPLYVIGRSTLGAPNSAPTDGDLANSQLSFYLNQAGNQLLVRVKYSDGTLKLATLSLT